LTNFLWGRIRVAKPSFFKSSGQDNQYSLERFWAQAGITDAGVTARFFQLFAGRGEAGGASESAQAVAGATDRTAALRAPELAAIAIPATGGVGALGLVDAAGTTDSGRAGIEGEAAARIATFSFTATPLLTMGAAAAGMPGYASDFIPLISEDLVATGIYEARTKTLLPGGPNDYAQLAQGAHDLLDISGDFSGGFLIGEIIRGLDIIVLRGGNDYNFTATDDLVQRGHTLTISAMPLAAGDSFLFDGSGETDGKFILLGSRGTDVFIGGGGDDRIYGNEGADILAGGGGADTFGYSFASDSSGPDYDTIGDFDAALDRIALGNKGGVTGFIDAIESGTLSLGSFDDDLGALLGGLGANQAAWVAPDAGDLAGTIFLVVDGNGEAGYQAGEDYVFAIGGSPLEDLTGKTDFFI
jgi:Ca2+-binding RTX toxin-like protein